MRWVFGWLLGLSVGAGAIVARAQERQAPTSRPESPAQPSPEALQFFETKIRPLFAERCYACHGTKSQRAGLRMDDPVALRKGGDSGPALVPGDPEKSLLLTVLHYDGAVKMPPQGKLKPQQIEDVAAWIRLGAPWPVVGGGGRGAGGQGAAPVPSLKQPSRTTHWSFQPVRAPRVPKVKDSSWGRNPIDRFVLARLEVKGLRPSEPASKRELARRAYFDLVGLPPSPEELDRFLADPRPDAYERLVDHLLSRPQFGERWGRHWLDVVRFAQTNGYERDDEKPNAWRYRDYVIQSLNQDKLYDRFVREQLAGDELDEVSDDTLIATAFYRLGVWDDEPDEPRQAEFDNLDDVLSTTTQVFMGLTVGCARCHDHKFDPILQRDYYALLGFIRNVKRYVKAEDKEAAQTIFANLKAGGQTLAVREAAEEPPKVHVLIRGNAATPGAEVQPRFLQALCRSESAAVPVLPTKAANRTTSGRRRVLAEWITSSDHPLTARVAVNRVWQHLFGRGIVATPNDFGATGTPPTHPELLDWLASHFAGGASGEGRGASSSCSQLAAQNSQLNAWSLKSLIRLIMTSATYRQSSRVRNARAAATDPGNTLLWRQSMRRLEAEAVRDSILAASGKLNLKMGGRGIFPTLPPEVLATQSRPGNGWDKSGEAEQSRRSVYIFVKRTLGVPLLETLDVATPDSSVAARPTTTIAPQALLLLNSQFMDEQAATFADRLLKEGGQDRDWHVERAFRLALSRRPTTVERKIARDYLERASAEAASGSPEEAYRRGLTAYCKVILNLNEFVYVD